MKKRLVHIYLFIFSVFAFAQQQENLLEAFKTLRIQLRDTSVSSEKAKLLALEYLKKAKKTNDKKLIGRGYYLIAAKNFAYEERLHYLDSAVMLTENLENDALFPLLPYMMRASTFYKLRNYPEALNNYLLAESVAKSKGNITYEYDMKNNIAVLKRISGDYEEAAELLKECLVHEKQRETFRVNIYLYTLLQLSSVYYESEQTKKAASTNKEGIQLALQYNKEKLYYHFLVNEGINQNVKGNYQKSIDSITKGFPHLEKNDQLVAEFYLGKNYYALNDKPKAIDYFKKIDNFYNENKDLFPPLREAYVYLINYYRAKDNPKKELKYTKQLLEIDSTIHADYRYLSKNITKKYDIPAYVASKERLIDKLQGQKQQIISERNWIIIGSGAISLVGVFMLVYYYRQKKSYEKRYHEIMSKSTASVEEKISVQDAQHRPISLEIDSTIVEEVLQSLESFEASNAYLENQISLKDVAKLVNTNSKYLSKIVNSYKEKNFTTYINDMRIEYLINHLQTETKYQKYTIRAIAEEIGFSNPEGFSRAFQKKTGLKPSYFIKKVREATQKKQ
ncbi:helix-turn-helix domain-containing protein [Kordia sp. TARA_039_SRF]|nr:helix-turn-helix domain-containing protein [Kordia sp. TARA_039_SRF]